MKDKEMIEEMAKEIETAKQGIWASVRTRKEDEDYLWHSRAIAEYLAVQGYRKLPENSVVVTKQRFEALETIENYHIKSCGKDSVVLSMEEYNKLKYQWITDSEAYKKGSKETAEKFAEMVITNLKDNVNADNVDLFVECRKIIDETLKEFIKE